MEKERIHRYLNNYFQENITPEDEKMLFEFLSNPKNEILAKEILSASWDLQIPGKEMSNAASEQIFSLITKEKSRSNGTIKLNWFIGVAAAAAIAIFTAGFFSRTLRSSKIQAEHLITASVKNEHDKVILPDGSVVILNSNSEISYSEDFDSKSREVSLKGEAYFDIKHDPLRPFIVHVGKFSTQVLGTAFNIRSSKDSSIAVTVIRGKVSVSKADTLLGTLTPGEQIHYDIQRMLPLLTKVDAKKAISWQANDLFFKDVSLSEVMDSLSVRFNTKITFTKPLGKDCRLTATFLKGETLEEILKVISTFNGMQYSKTESGLLISAQPCSK